jgi:hypothetical protein
MESRELTVGYRWGLMGRNGLDRRTTYQMDKVWCEI